MLEVAVWIGVGMAVGVGVIATTVLLRRREAASAAAWQHLLTELERARRYDRPFAVARLSPGATSLLLPSGDAFTRSVLRRTDYSWPVGDDLYVVLPEADDAAAQRWTDRVLVLIEEVDVELRVACFPDDGQTTGALLATLQGHPAGSAQRLRTAPGDARWAS